MFKCKTCLKTFQSKFALNGHLRIHTKSNGKLYKPLCCCILTKRVIQSSFLTQFQKKLKYCKNCNKVIYGSKKFCNNSCAAKFNNIQRIKNGYIISDQHKNKTSTSLAKTLIKKGYFLLEDSNNNNLSGKKCCKNLPTQVVGDFSKLYRSTCPNCNTLFLNRKKVKYCKNCKNKYSTSAKQSFKFTFNIYNYPNLFDLTLVEKLGWFSPGGRCGKWNLNGVSRDHKISVNESIKNGFDPFYISHPLNCELMPHKDNNKKKHNSSITYEELIKQVDEFEFSRLLNKIDSACLASNQQPQV